ncbi:MAG TPA: translation initiation factor IF-2 subunit gamma [Candidatus Nanoarchaeia archaeon]|nr:translation initiation factor IF-2 subunit gamma [Candidatus Nanoarchaeia archaeon]
MVKTIAKDKETGTAILDVPTITVGIFGHIDHGKTTLLYKLSGKWTDTHSEEMKRGITIKLGYADIVLSKDSSGYNKEGRGEAVRHVSFVDAPGHEMLMSTMLSGAALVDVAILVVAANEGIKPQTREHLMALQAKRVSRLIVVQNKIDLASKEQALKNYTAIKELLKEAYVDAPIIPVSAQQGVNLESIYEALAEILLPVRSDSGTPLFVVARSFDINRPGTVPATLHGAVLGGTLKRGSLKVGDSIEIKPGRIIKEANQYHYRPLTASVLALFNGSNSVETLTPGGSMSIETSLDMALGRNDLLAGNVVSTVGGLSEPTMELHVRFTLFPQYFLSSGVSQKTEMIKPSEMLMLSIGSSISGGVVKHVKGEVIDLSLKVPVVAGKGENVALARQVQGHWRLIGYGEII